MLIVVDVLHFNCTSILYNVFDVLEDIKSQATSKKQLYKLKQAE